MTTSTAIGEGWSWTMELLILSGLLAMFGTGAMWATRPNVASRLEVGRRRAPWRYWG